MHKLNEKLKARLIAGIVTMGFVIVIAAIVPAITFVLPKVERIVVFRDLTNFFPRPKQVARPNVSRLQRRLATLRKRVGRNQANLFARADIQQRQLSLQEQRRQRLDKPFERKKQRRKLGENSLDSINRKRGNDLEIGNSKRRSVELGEVEHARRKLDSKTSAQFAELPKHSSGLSNMTLTRRSAPVLQVSQYGNSTKKILNPLLQWMVDNSQSLPSSLRSRNMMNFEANNITAVDSCYVVDKEGVSHHYIIYMLFKAQNPPQFNLCIVEDQKDMTLLLDNGGEFNSEGCRTGKVFYPDGNLVVASQPKQVIGAHYERFRDVFMTWWNSVGKG